MLRRFVRIDRNRSHLETRLVAMLTLVPIARPGPVCRSNGFHGKAGKLTRPLTPVSSTFCTYYYLRVPSSSNFP